MDLVNLQHLRAQVQEEQIKVAAVVEALILVDVVSLAVKEL